MMSYTIFYQAMLYALAIKFLSREEMEKVKEVMSMTVLGEMLMQDGRDQERARINKLNQSLKNDNRLEDLLHSIDDPKFQEQLMKEYGF